jgi:hypothetical protein
MKVPVDKPSHNFDPLARPEDREPKRGGPSASTSRRSPQPHLQALMLENRPAPKAALATLLAGGALPHPPGTNERIPFAAHGAGSPQPLLAPIANPTPDYLLPFGQVYQQGHPHAVGRPHGPDLAWASDPSAHRLPTSAFAQASGGFTETPENVLSHGDIVSPTPRVPHASSSSQAALAQPAVQSHLVEVPARGSLKTPKNKHFRHEVKSQIIALSEDGWTPASIANTLGMEQRQVNNFLFTHRNPNAQKNSKLRAAQAVTGDMNVNTNTLTLVNRALKCQYDENGAKRPIVELTDEAQLYLRSWKAGDRISLPVTDGGPVRYKIATRDRQPETRQLTSDFVSLAPALAS